MSLKVGKFRSQEDRADAELRQLLGNETPTSKELPTLHGSLPWRRSRKEPGKYILKLVFPFHIS